MKRVLWLFVVLLLIPTVLAIDLTIEKISERETIVLGLDKPAVFKINVTNNGPTNDFTFYTFFGLGMNRSEPINIRSGETKELSFEIYQEENLKIEDFTAFDYYIRDRHGNEIYETFVLNIVRLEEAFNIGTSPINPESTSLEVYIHNKINFDFEKINVKFTSAFFDFEEELALGPNEKATFEVNLDKKDFDELMAGFYKLSAEVNVEDLSANIDGKIEFREKNLLETRSRNYGFFVSTKIIQTINEGNMVEEANVTLKRNVITRIFTNIEPEPTSVNREGMTIYYNWNKELNPGEVHEVVLRTNWLYPFLAIIFIILIVYFSKKYSRTDLVLKKKVHFVNAKGGEFALKVTVLVEAKEYMEKVKIIDRLPPLVKVYGRFGGEIPARFHKNSKIFEWDFDRLEAGEKRVLSYIIYSKVGVLGKFALPSTRGVFNREGNQKEVTSNKVYFLAQQNEGKSFN